MDLRFELTIAEIMRAEARLEDLRRAFGRSHTVSARNLYRAEELLRRAKALCIETRGREAPVKPVDDHETGGLNVPH